MVTKDVCGYALHVSVGTKSTSGVTITFKEGFCFVLDFKHLIFLELELKVPYLGSGN